MKAGLGTGALAAGLILWSLQGCSSDPPSAAGVGASSSAVQGGTVDQTHGFAVGICIGGKGPNCAAVCSGALITPNLVVTARHCVDNISSDQVDCSVAKFGGPLGPASAFWITTNYSLFQSTVGWHQVSKIVTPTPTPVCGNDLALLILTGNVPAGEATPITPAVEYPITDHTKYSTTESAIGYGLTSPTNQNSAGTRHIRQNINIQCIPGDTQIDCGALVGSEVDTKEFVAGDGTCEGDSGSSAYEQQSFNANQPVSLGVLSRGGISSDGTTCVSSIYTRLDSWKDLIVQTAQQAAQQGGYPVPLWAGGTDAPTPDAGPSGDASAAPAPGEFGATCASDGECKSNTCHNYNGGTLICTQSCDPTKANACPGGYDCTKGFCFPKTDTGNKGTTTTTTTTGCAIARGSPPPFAAIGLGLLGFAAVRRRRVGAPSQGSASRKG
jgi:hypothetical protein